MMHYCPNSRPKLNLNALKTQTIFQKLTYRGVFNNQFTVVV